ncbi:hypothetical protein AVEN_274360-1 [Araneus ventricosus]|uniref:Uncharacterized protein n=1 Tax=Araneus ventricosus TaxID=182803 RepID=A0A4Y2GCI0_ARAVE|nr:hypothetical protein AVEN_274360-1 [Araneus ventricosus]
MDITDDDRPGQLATSISAESVAVVAQVIRKNRRIKLKEISSMGGLAPTTINPLFKLVVLKWLENAGGDFNFTSIEKLIVLCDKCFNSLGEYIEK